MSEIQPDDEVQQLIRELGDRLDQGRAVAAATRGAAGARAIELWREKALVQHARDASLAAEDPIGADRVHGIHLAEIGIELNELLDHGVPPRAARSVALAGSAAVLLRDLIATQGVESRSVNEWLGRYDEWYAAYADVEPPAAPAPGSGDVDAR